MILNLHRGLAKLVPMVSPSEHSRFGATSYLLLEIVDDRWRACATNGRQLCVVSGPHEWPEKKPDPTPDIKRIYLPPAGLATAFEVIRGDAYGVCTKDGMFRVFEFGERSECGFAAFDQETAGRFPNFLQVIPKSAPSPTMSMINPRLLWPMLDAAVAFGDESAAEFSVHDQEKMVSVKQKCDGVEFLAILVQMQAWPPVCEKGGAK